MTTGKEGLEELIGKDVLLLCSAYIYYGKLIAVVLDSAQLEGAHIVYETGAWENAPNWKDAQALPNQKCWGVSRLAIESFGVVPKENKEQAPKQDA